MRLNWKTVKLSRKEEEKEEVSIEWQSISAGEERDPVSATLLSPPARSLTWLLALIFEHFLIQVFSGYSQSPGQQR